MKRILTASVFIIIILTGCFLPSNPTTYDRIYIDTYDPEWGLAWVRVDTKLYLYDRQGTELAASTGGVASFDEIDYQGGLRSGIYYIKIAIQPGETLVDEQPYVIRITKLSLIDPKPAKQTIGVIASDPFEADDYTTPWTGDNPTDIFIDDIVGRTLDTDADVDWVELRLP